MQGRKASCQFRDAPNKPKVLATDLPSKTLPPSVLVTFKFVSDVSFQEFQASQASQRLQATYRRVSTGCLVKEFGTFPLT